MEKKRSQTTVLVLENRQMIATIIADLLEGAGYRTHVVATISEARDTLPEHVPALLLADVGLIRSEQPYLWQELEEMTRALDTPLCRFSCSPMPESQEGDLLVLRSPGDFALVVERVERELRESIPYLGTTLVTMNLLTMDQLEAALRIQKELEGIDRALPLGDLLVRLDFVDPEDIEKALQAQEL